MPEQGEPMGNPRRMRASEIAARLVQQAKQKADTKAFSAATRYFRTRKAERGTVILIAATKTRRVAVGQRVTKAFKGKVYPVYVNKNGKKEFYREYKKTDAGVKRRARVKTPQARPPASVDPSQFATKSSKKKAATLLFARGSQMQKPVTVTSATGNVRWHETVVPKVLDSIGKLLQKEIGDRPTTLSLLFEVTARVEMPDGSIRVIEHKDSLGKQASQTNIDKLYQPFLERKLYAGVAQSLEDLQLVSAGSARYVGRLPENKGKLQPKWTRKKKPWVKRKFAVARVASVSVLTTVMKAVAQ